MLVKAAAIETFKPATTVTNQVRIPILPRRRRQWGALRYPPDHPGKLDPCGGGFRACDIAKAPP
jgi:hypothetical protein